MTALDRWESALRESGLGDTEVAERRTVLDEFCAFAELSADDVVESCVDRDKGKIVASRRKKIEDLIDEFAADGGDNSRRATQRANVVRSFLIHNGVRVLTPKAPWL